MSEQEDIHDEFKRQNFVASRAIRYYTSRKTFWMTLLVSSEVLGLMLNASAFTFLFINLTIGKVIVAAACLLSLLIVCFQASTRCQKNLEQKVRFHDHLKLFPVDPAKETYELLKTIKDNRIAIEKDDDTLFPCLSVICHNQECVARGIPEEIKYLTWFQSNIGRILPIPYVPRIKTTTLIDHTPINTDNYGTEIT